MPRLENHGTFRTQITINVNTPNAVPSLQCGYVRTQVATGSPREVLQRRGRSGFLPTPAFCDVRRCRREWGGTEGTHLKMKHSSLLWFWCEKWTLRVVLVKTEQSFSHHDIIAHLPEIWPVIAKPGYCAKACVLGEKTAVQTNRNALTSSVRSVYDLGPTPTAWLIVYTTLHYGLLDTHFHSGESIRRSELGFKWLFTKNNSKSTCY